MTCFGPPPLSVPSDVIASGCPRHVDRKAAHRSQTPVCTTEHARLGKHAHGSAPWIPVAVPNTILTFQTMGNLATGPIQAHQTVVTCSVRCEQSHASCTVALYQILWFESNVLHGRSNTTTPIRMHWWEGISSHQAAIHFPWENITLNEKSRPESQKQHPGGTHGFKQSLWPGLLKLPSLIHCTASTTDFQFGFANNCPLCTTAPRHTLGNELWVHMDKNMTHTNICSAQGPCKRQHSPISICQLIPQHSLALWALKMLGSVLTPSGTKHEQQAHEFNSIPSLNSFYLQSKATASHSFPSILQSWTSSWQPCKPTCHLQYSQLQKQVWKLTPFVAHRVFQSLQFFGVCLRSQRVSNFNYRVQWPRALLNFGSQK